MSLCGAEAGGAEEALPESELDGPMRGIVLRCGGVAPILRLHTPDLVVVVLHTSARRRR